MTEFPSVAGMFQRHQHRAAVPSSAETPAATALSTATIRGTCRRVEAMGRARRNSAGCP
ncbi:hypothetical protein [Amycolatopsis minnesotensis]|uniref:hypothetical protein n=1 Tax=Amycolatopsis minnesotensis TaxID=337894 RepID=UPI0031D5D355